MTLKVFCDICEDLIKEKAEGEGEDVGVLSFFKKVLGDNEAFEPIVLHENLCDICVDIIKTDLAISIHKCKNYGKKRRNEKQ